MSDEAALLAAIIAHPDEDTPRLIYADWLDEHDQPERAEFIRLQCAPDADEAAEDRAAELEERNRAEWLAGLPQFPGADWEFRRGFPEYLDIRVQLLLDRYDAFARMPWLRFLSIHGLRNGTVRDFCNRTWNSRWVELELQEDPETIDDIFQYDATASAIALANCPQVDQLRRLWLSQFSFDYDDSDPPLAALRQQLGDRLVIH
jgi:uncharacterized protein (TIGR02996 family)